MTISPLTVYTKVSPNKSSRKAKIDTITIHHMACNPSIETQGENFAATSRQASSNYGIGTDGRIACYVPEEYRSWCSSNKANDDRAITIEVANDGGAPDWHISDTAINALIKLCADICKRNGISELKWSDNKSLVGQIDKQNVTIHQWFAATACPGPYLHGKLSYVVAETNKLLKGAATEPENAPQQAFPQVPFTIKISKNMVYRSMPSVTSPVKGNTNAGTFSIVEISGNFGKLKSGAGWVDLSLTDQYSIVGATTLTPPIQKTEPEPALPYSVRVTTSALNIRKGPGTNYPVVACIFDKGVYTITEEQNGFGKLKSGAGWISLNYTSKI